MSLSRLSIVSGNGSNFEIFLQSQNSNKLWNLKHTLIVFIKRSNISRLKLSIVPSQLWCFLAVTALGQILMETIDTKHCSHICWRNAAVNVFLKQTDTSGLLYWESQHCRINYWCEKVKNENYVTFQEMKTQFKLTEQ